LKGLELKEKRENLGLTQKEFADLIGKSGRTIITWEQSEVLSASQVVIVQSIFDKYENTSDENFHFNESSTEYKNAQAIWVEYDGFMLVPLITQRAQAGYLNNWDDQEYLAELPKIPWEVDKEYKGKYLTFEVSGDSMESDNESYDSIFEGDILLCREIQRQHWKNKLHINKWDFVIVHRDHGILAKRIIKHDVDKGLLTLHSLNSYYEDINVSMNDLIAIFNIIDVKRKRKRR